MTKETDRLRLLFSRHRVLVTALLLLTGLLLVAASLVSRTPEESEIRMMPSVLAIEDVEFDLESGRLTVLVRNEGPNASGLRLDTASFSVIPLSSGSNYTTTVDVSSITLGLNEVAEIISPQLSSLSEGDIVHVKVTTKAPSFALAEYCRAGEFVKPLSECN